MSDSNRGQSQSLPSAAELQVHEVIHLPTVASTMDEAHARASSGAEAGTVIIADEQTAGRGRGGNSWQSEPGFGVWFTLIERPTDAAAVDVLSIRLGLAIASAVQPFISTPVQLKWPNDLYVNGRKLAGILVEARWREGVIDWVAIGVGINLRVPPNNEFATALDEGTTRNDVLLRLLPQIRAAASVPGSLNALEQLVWSARDLSVGHAVTAPIAGVVRGIECDGALRIEDSAGVVHELRSGSLVFASPSPIHTPSTT